MPARPRPSPSSGRRLCLRTACVRRLPSSVTRPRRRSSRPCQCAGRPRAPSSPRRNGSPPRREDRQERVARPQQPARQQPAASSKQHQQRTTPARRACVAPIASAVSASVVTPSARDRHAAAGTGREWLGGSALAREGCGEGDVTRAASSRRRRHWRRGYR